MKHRNRYWKLPLRACLASSLMSVGMQGSALMAEQSLLDLDSAVSAAAPMEISEADADLQDADFQDPVLSDGATEVINERYPDGKVKIRREMKQDEAGNYIRHGEWKMWDQKGNLVAEGTYKENERHGQWTRWYAANDAKLFSQAPYNRFEGPFVSIATFKDGKLDGKWSIFDGQQRLISEWDFADGLRDGAVVWYHPQGKKLEEITYSKGLVDGHMKIWNGEGELVTDDEYQKGRKLAVKTEHYPNGSKKTEGMYLHAEYVVKTADDWWKAEPATFTTNGKDERHGAFTAWHQNGQKEYEGEFKNDLRVGEFNYWYSNGQKRLQGSYDLGKPDGRWVWWHINGQKATQGQYAAGEPSGPWAYWKEDGQLHQKADYSAKPDSSVVLKDEERKESASILTGPERDLR